MMKNFAIAIDFLLLAGLVIAGEQIRPDLESNHETGVSLRQETQLVSSKCSFLFQSLSQLRYFISVQFIVFASS